MPAPGDIQDLLAAVPGVEVGRVREPSGGGGRADVRIDLRAGGWRVKLDVLWLGDRRGLVRKLDELRGRPPGPSLTAIAAPVLGPSLRREIQEAGVGWIDGRGGMHLESDDPPLFFHVEPPAQGGAFEKRRVFSPIASGVVRVLLEKPDEPLRIADLQEQMVAWSRGRGPELDPPSRGAVSRALHGLVESELVRRDTAGWHADRPGQLLDAWLADGATRLTRSTGRAPAGARRLGGWYLSGPYPERLDAVLEAAARLGIGVWMSGLCAAERVEPYLPADVVDAYVFPAAMASVLGDELKAVPTDEGADLRLAGPRDPWTLAGAHAVDGVPVVGKAQIIADLSVEGPRALDVADRLRKAWGL